jgi:hypothetical protein
MADLCSQPIDRLRSPPAPGGAVDTESLSLRIWFNWRRLMRSVTQIAMVRVGLYRGLGQPQPTLHARKISLQSAPRHGNVTLSTSFSSHNR